MCYERRLRRNPCNRILGGVCGGIAEYFELSPTLVRLIYIIVSVCSAAFPGILVYLFLWMLIPLRKCMCGCCCD
ncbi:MAG: PspC domain-containing protein [Promethearchaeota archaeon]|jgi:phage shock protein C